MWRTISLFDIYYINPYNYIPKDRAPFVYKFSLNITTNFNRKAMRINSPSRNLTAMTGLESFIIFSHFIIFYGRQLSLSSKIFNIIFSSKWAITEFRAVQKSEYQVSEGDFWSALTDVFRTNLVAGIDSAEDIETENIVDCGVSCSSLQAEWSTLIGPDRPRYSALIFFLALYLLLLW